LESIGGQQVSATNRQGGPIHLKGEGLTAVIRLSLQAEVTDAEGALALDCLARETKFPASHWHLLTAKSTGPPERWISQREGQGEAVATRLKVDLGLRYRLSTCERQGCLRPLPGVDFKAKAEFGFKATSLTLGPLENRSRGHDHRIRAYHSDVPRDQARVGSREIEGLGGDLPTEAKLGPTRHDTLSPDGGAR
jgi:hypothetical protein